jgi:hypothetical protein
MAMKSALIPVFLLPVALAVACSDDENNGPQPTVFNVPLATQTRPPCVRTRASAPPETRR